MTVARWISLVVALAFCVYAGTLQPAMVVAAMLYMVGPLLGIWFSDVLGMPDSVLAKLMAWIFLAITPLAVYLIHFRLEWIAEEIAR